MTTEELAMYVNEKDADSKFFVGLPEDMMNDWIQQEAQKGSRVHENLGTWRNYVAWQALGAVPIESQQLDTSDYEEAEPSLLSVNFDDTYKVGKIYVENVYVNVLGESEYLLGERTMDYYKASEKFYYDAQSNVGTHIDFTFDIKVFEDEEYAQAFKVYIRDYDESKVRPATSEEVTIAVSGYDCYLRFNKPGYYAVKVVPVNLATGEVYTYQPSHKVHVVEE